MRHLFALTFLLVSISAPASEEANLEKLKKPIFETSCKKEKTQCLEEVKEIKKEWDKKISPSLENSKKCKDLKVSKKEPCLKKVDRKIAKAQYKKLAIKKCLKKGLKKCHKIVSSTKEDCLFLKKNNIVCNNGNRMVAINDRQKRDETETSGASDSNSGAVNQK